MSGPEHFPSPSPPRPAGVLLFSILLLISSFVHVHKLVVDHSLYLDYYAYWGKGLALTRYAFSWFQRILGISSALAMLSRRDWGRKLAIVIGLFTMATLYWKHPYQAFKNHTQYLDQLLGGLFYALGVSGVTFESLTIPALIVHYFLDILFCSAMIYYLTRPGVKSYFRGP
ncbi:MAG: hypothetical protein Q8Q08_02340 [Candidatus Omnitrophota bacterium]|nr:hypothetical protein [Candidatus Omnitrophota bacterium]MDZ4242990.1 hypothetical protein [Candidatus Omnitrophota bacterium]